MKCFMSVFAMLVLAATTASAARHDNEPDCTADPECAWSETNPELGGHCHCIIGSGLSFDPVDVSNQGSWICAGSDYDLEYRGRALLTGREVDFKAVVIDENDVLVCEASATRRLPRDTYPRNRVEFLENQIQFALQALAEARFFGYRLAYGLDAYVAAGDVLNAESFSAAETLDCIANQPAEASAAEACFVCGCGASARRLRRAAANHNTTRSNRLPPG